MSFARKFRRTMRKKASAKKPRKVYLEPLEPRLLLSADLSYTMAAGANDLTIKLQTVDGSDTLQLINNVDPNPETQVLVSQALSETSAVVISGSDLDDILVIDLDFSVLPDSLLLDFHGNAGDDTLTGPDADNAWRITGSNEGTLNSRLSFDGIENLMGAGQTDTFIMKAEGYLSGLMDGAGGDDELMGPDIATLWRLTGSGEGSINDQGTFGGIENLTGGSDQDIYVFDDAAGISGLINGGFGFNTLDYGARTTGVSIDLGTGTATGTGTAAFIQEFIGGAEEDTLIGASGANTWMIGGDNEGSINNEIYFEGFENLTGSAENEDAFVFTSAGSLSGLISGGDGGYDSLIIQSAADGTVVVAPDGSIGDNGETIVYDGRTINFSGLESFVDSSNPDEVVINATVLDDALRLEGDPDFPGNTRIESLNYRFLLSDGSLADSISFANPANSLAINLKAGDDSFTLGEFDPGLSAAVSISGGGGEDELAAQNDVNSWQIMGDGEGTLNTVIAFAGMENLTGGSEADTFVFTAGSGISGVIAGGAGDDLLAGPDSDSIWRITGPDEGELEDPGTGETVASFFDIENLGGGAANEDSFLFTPQGSLSGSLAGGEGGYDSLVIQTGGGETVVVVAGSTAADAAVYDGRTVHCSGLEPFVDTSDPDNIVIKGTVLDDEIVLEDADPAIAGVMQVRGANLSTTGSFQTTVR